MNKSSIEEGREEAIDIKEQANVSMEAQQWTDGGSQQVNIT